MKECKSGNKMKECTPGWKYYTNNAIPFHQNKIYLAIFTTSHIKTDSNVKKIALKLPEDRKLFGLKFYNI